VRIEGARDVPAPREAVWAAFLDPARLAAAMPGCERLEAVGEGEYRATMKIGVAGLTGTFTGKVTLSDLEPPARYRMAMQGEGDSGFVRGEATMELADIEGGTRVSYAADVHVGGLIASVGQRMLAGVAKIMLGQFFARMVEQLQAGRA
jgi:carbon monoxide dehydrogenase subunit G